MTGSLRAKASLHTITKPFYAQCGFQFIPDQKRTVFHLGVNLRNGSPKQGQLQFRSRPESFTAPYFVDTGKFAATNTKMAGYETYYRKGPLLLGSEYWWVGVSSPSTHNPTIHGGDFCCDMVGHRRDACLQHGPRSFQRCHTQEAVVLRRLWCCRAGREGSPTST